MFTTNNFKRRGQILNYLNYIQMIIYKVNLHGFIIFLRWAEL